MFQLLCQLRNLERTAIDGARLLPKVTGKDNMNHELGVQ